MSSRNVAGPTVEDDLELPLAEYKEFSKDESVKQGISALRRAGKSNVPIDAPTSSNTEASPRARESTPPKETKADDIQPDTAEPMTFTQKLAESLHRRANIAEERMVGLRDTIMAQDKQITHLMSQLEAATARITTLESQLKEHKVSTSETIESVTQDLRARLDDNMKIHERVPHMIERLVTASSEIRSSLPEPTRETVRTIKLEDDEKKVLDTITKRVQKPAKKLPKYLR